MIDFVHLSAIIQIPFEYFLEGAWYYGSDHYGYMNLWRNQNGVKLRYYPATNTFTITGTILKLLYDTQVLNVDDLYQADIEQFITDINDVLNDLFTIPVLDIRSFTVKRIDYCFNIQTPYVTEYLSFLTKAFQRCDRGARKNFAQEMQKFGSVYIKTRSDYENDERRNYVLNYYDKEDRLTHLYEKGRHVAEADFQHARGILRLEVQCGFQFVRAICEKMRIGKTFAEMFSYDVAYCAHEICYSRVFHCDATQDFYKYEAAKKLIPRRNEAARTTLQLSAMHRSIVDQSYTYGRKVIQQAGIYPYCFLDKHGSVEVLVNPLKLILGKLQAMGIPITGTLDDSDSAADTLKTATIC